MTLHALIALLIPPALAGDPTCLSAYGRIACGYGCAAEYGVLRCAESPQGACTAANGSITCWEPAAR